MDFSAAANVFVGGNILNFQKINTNIKPKKEN